MFKLGTTPLYNGILAAFYMAVEGIIGSMFFYGSLPLFFYYYEVSVLDYQKVLTVGMLPWSCKPFPAVISELFPIRGKHKQWYAASVSTLIPFFILGVVLSKKPTDATVFFTITSTYSHPKLWHHREKWVIDELLIGHTAPQAPWS